MEVDRRAERELARLPDVVLQRIVARLLALRENAFPPGSKKLQGGGYRLRVGDYRVLEQFKKECSVRPPCRTFPLHGSRRPAETPAASARTAGTEPGRYRKT